MSQVGGTIDNTRCGHSCDSKEGSHMWIGFLGAVIAIVLFGSNFVPVKKFETGDGMCVHPRVFESVCAHSLSSV